MGCEAFRSRLVHSVALLFMHSFKISFIANVPKYKAGLNMIFVCVYLSSNNIASTIFFNNHAMLFTYLICFISHNMSGWLWRRPHMP